MRHTLILCFSLASAAAFVSPARAPRHGRSVSRSSQVVLQEDLAAKRAESGKAAAVSLVAGTAGGLPFLLLSKFAQIPPSFSEISWEFQADGLALMLLLFGVVYRYAVRDDDNPQLKQGVAGAFVITRSWALITPPATCTALPLSCGAPLGYFNWDMILDGSFAAVETGAACAAAAFALEFCFTKGWVQRCVDGV